MRRFIATTCLLFVFSASAFASGFSIYEASARANAMLGAFAAYAEHVSTIYYNPSGMAGLHGLHISGGATIIAPRSTFRGPFPSNTPFPGNQQKYQMKKDNFFVPNFFASYEIKDGLAAGVGVYAPYGLGTEWNRNWVGRTQAIKTSVQTVFVQPTVAYTLPNFGIGKVKVGAGLMIAAYGSVELSRAVEDFAVQNDVFDLQGDLKKPGLGYNLGLLIQPNDMISLGFTYRSKVKVTFSGDADFGDLPTSLFPTSATGETTLELPANWAAALNVKPMKDLSFEFDYVWWGWSSYDKLVINFDQDIAAFTQDNNPNTTARSLSSKRGYKNSYQLRLGGEYKNLGVPGLALRAGIAYDQTPLPKKYMDPTLPDSDRWLFSGGLSYDITPNFTVDASYIFIRAKERVNRESLNGFHGVYNTYANLPSLGLTLKF